MITTARFNDNGARPLRNVFLNANSALDICLLVGYCFVIFGIMPIFVVASWGLEAFSLSFLAAKD